ncbi:MAG TPA: zinc-finger domain-containing protein [Rhodospirillaceae bacterium]|nr:zinc-finger domain-containing protein [Rhodospirillaceae bacterium]
MTKDVETVNSSPVACEGNGPVSGHPRVYLTFTQPNREVVCPYCSRTFVLAPGASADHGH